MSRTQVAIAGVVLLAALTVQLTVLSRLPLPGATPDVLLLCVVAFALGWGPGPGSVLGFGAGLALDLVPPTDSAVGQWAFVLCVVGYLSGLVRRAGEGSVLVPLAVVAAASAGSTLLYAAMAGLVGDPRVTWPLVVRYVPTGVIYAVILSPFVVSAVLALARRVEGKEVTGP